jgi:Tol biopolymer transport system component
VFSLRAAPVDRFGNPRSDPVTLTPLDDRVSVTGLTVTALTVGRGRIELAASSWPKRDTVFVSVVPDGVLAATTGTSLIVLQTDGTTLQVIPLAAGGAFTADWAPGGGEIAIDGLSSNERIRVVDLAGSIRRPTSPLPGIDLYPEYSADGQWLYYSRNDAAGWTVRRVRPDGSDDTGVIATSGLDVAPSPSPDGSRIAYVVTGPDELRLHTIATQSSIPLALPGHTPAWSPEGDRIGYISAGEIHLINPDGSNSRRLTTGFSYTLGIDFSPDGRWIVAVHHTGQIHLVDTESGDAMGIPFTQPLTAVTWRPN